MDTGLLPFLSWCVENLAPEAESAARWADHYMAVPDRRERARRMVGDLSSRVVASGTPRDFVEELPGVRGHLGVEGGYLVFRAVKTHLYVAAAQGIPLVDRTMLEDQSLLLLGAEFGLPAFVAALAEKRPAPKVLRHHFPRGREEAAELLGTELARRVAHVERQSFAGTLRGALEFLTLAAASDFANAYYDDGKVSPEEFAELRRAGARRAVAVTGLLKLMARADGVITVEEEAVLEAIRHLLPEQDAGLFREVMNAMSPGQLPEVLPFAEERQGLLRCMVTMASADRRVDPAEEALCRNVAELLEIPAAELDATRARLQVSPAGGP